MENQMTAQEMERYISQQRKSKKSQTMPSKPSLNNSERTIINDTKNQLIKLGLKLMSERKNQGTQFKDVNNFVVKL